jgi:hypothetical protein
VARTLPDLRYAVRTHGQRSGDFAPASRVCGIPVLHEHCALRGRSRRSARSVAIGRRRVSVYGCHRACVFRTTHDTRARAAPECGHRPPCGPRRAAARSARTAILCILKRRSHFASPGTPGTDSVSTKPIRKVHKGRGKSATRDPSATCTITPPIDDEDAGTGEPHIRAGLPMPASLE